MFDYTLRAVEHFLPAADHPEQGGELTAIRGDRLMQMVVFAANDESLRVGVVLSVWASVRAKRSGETTKTVYLASGPQESTRVGKIRVAQLSRHDEPDGGIEFRATRFSHVVVRDTTQVFCELFPNTIKYAENGNLLFGVCAEKGALLRRALLDANAFRQRWQMPAPDHGGASKTNAAERVPFKPTDFSKFKEGIRKTIEAVQRCFARWEEKGVHFVNEKGFVVNSPTGPDKAVVELKSKDGTSFTPSELAGAAPGYFSLTATHGEKKGALYGEGVYLDLVSFMKSEANFWIFCKRLATQCDDESSLQQTVAAKYAAKFKPLDI